MISIRYPRTMHLPSLSEPRLARSARVQCDSHRPYHHREFNSLHSSYLYASARLRVCTSRAVRISRLASTPALQSP